MRKFTACHVRELWVGCLIAAMVAIVCAEPYRLTAETLPAARREAAGRKRRVIMNNDGNDSREAPTKDRAGFLQSRSLPLVGSQVDAIFYCTGIWGTFTHKSANAELRVGSDQGYQEWAAHLADDGGPDALGTIVDFGHQHGMEVFWSLRMNDTHDSGDPTMMSAWKKANPECLAGSWDERSKYRGGGRRWSAVNYAHAMVRDRTVGWFDEVAANYDVDGVELDFFRHPVFFASTLRGEHATPDECEAMNSVIRRIRDGIDKHALRRGRPLLLAIRVPDSAGYCRALGLDVEQWLKEGLVDLMIVSGYFRLNPWQTSVDLGHKYGVKVYGGLSESRLRDNQARAVRASPEGYRARAMNVWHAGADGVYVFNLFNPRHSVWRELGEPAALAAMDKVYTTGARDVRDAGSWLQNGLRFLNRAPVFPGRPVTLMPGKAAEVTLRVGENLLQRKAQGIAPLVTLELSVPKLAAENGIAVTLNGEALTEGKLADGRWRCGVDPARVVQGENKVGFVLDAASNEKIEVQDLLLWVRSPHVRSAAPIKRDHKVFVEAGEKKAVKVSGKEWVAKDGWVECAAPGDQSARLLSNVSIGPGDFSVKARLSITGLARSAASFRFGDGSQAVFGFEGGHGSMYVAGPFFGTDPVAGKIGPSSDFIQDGKPFDLEVTREGDQFRILIDGRLVRQQTVGIGEMGAVSFVPIRSTMRVQRFSATANFMPFGLSPARNVNEVSRITIHPVVKEMPDLKLGPFVRLADGGILTAEEQSAWITHDDGKTWSEHRIFPTGAPFRIKPERVVMRLRSGVILLVMNNWSVEKLSWNHQKNVPNPDMHRPTYLVRSFDEGKTWQAPQLLYDGYCGALRDAIQTRDGTVLIMGQELIFEDGRNSSRAYFSDDDGATWAKAPLLDVGKERGDHSGTIEGTLEQLKDGRIWTLLRTYHGWFYEAFSADDGRTWSPLPPCRSKIRSTGSPGLLQRLADGRLILIWNAIPNEGYVRREELAVAFSEDEGESWTPPLVIARNPTGRVSYPYLFEYAPGVLWITTMQGNFRGSARVDDLYQAATAAAASAAFYKSSRYYQEYKAE